MTQVDVLYDEASEDVQSCPHSKVQNSLSAVLTEQQETTSEKYSYENSKKWTHYKAVCIGKLVTRVYSFYYIISAVVSF